MIVFNTAHPTNRFIKTTKQPPYYKQRLFLSQLLIKIPLKKQRHPLLAECIKTFAAIALFSSSFFYGNHFHILPLYHLMWLQPLYHLKLAR